MRFVAHCMICLMFVSSFSGCLASEDDVDDGQYIDDEEDLIDYIEEGICGDIDGDGITYTLDSRIPGYSGETIALDRNIFRKASPINLDNNKDDIFGLAIDLGYPLVSQDNFSISLYAQMAKMIGKPPSAIEKVSMRI